MGGSVTRLGAGGFHTCGMLSDGRSQCWGNNQAGQIGDGSTFLRTTPTYVTDMDSTINRIGAGTYTTCAVTSYGGAKCWGLHANGQVGDASLPWQLAPAEVIELITTSLTINYATGAPGSFFTILGADFPASAPITLKVNNTELTPATITDDNGGLVIILDTASAEAGSYVATIVSIRSYNISFRLDESAAYHPQEDDGVIYQVPGGIAMTLSSYLPVNLK